MFLDEHFAAASRAREHWLGSAEGALALMLLLDQFPRNCFRGSAHSYATDGLARHYAMRAIEEGLDLQLVPKLRAFIYLPFEHSEDPLDQDRSVAMFDVLGDKEYLQYAELHRDIIRRFGRFPTATPCWVAFPHRKNWTTWPKAVSPVGRRELSRFATNDLIPPSLSRSPFRRKGL